MNDSNRAMKWLFLLGLVVLSIVILYPPREKLKGGIDLVGGTSLLFEIDTTGLEARETGDLASRVMNILKERVDPQGQLNLEWRPVGNTRLEIRMPRPPKEAVERREAYNAAIDALIETNLARFDVEAALNAQPEHREPKLDELVRGIEERRPLLAEVREAFDAYRTAQAGDDPEATEAAAQKYEAAMDRLLATSLPIVRFTDILALPPGERRTRELETIQKDHPSYKLAAAIEAYDRWAKNKADLEDPSDLKRKIRGAGVLEFRILAERDASSPSNTAAPVQPIEKYTRQLQQRGPRPRPGDMYEWLPIDNVLRFTGATNMEEFEATKDSPGRPIMEEYAGRYYALAHLGEQYGLYQGGDRNKQWSLVQAFPDQNIMTGENVVSFTLDASGGRHFGELTGNNVGRQLCIVLDGNAMSHATINERITTRCQISGRFTPEKVQELVRILEAGSLPARVKEVPLQEQTMGPSLGESNRQKGMTAAIWALIIVAAFVLLYYGVVAGGMADIALALNLLFVLAAMALMQATFTLPGIAGLILTVGMAVDANVLIFERFREEKDRGVVFKKALNAGYDKAFSTIFDANITTLITCFILGFVGSEEVKGFAIVLGIGIATSMFTALVVTRLAFNTMIAAGWLKDLRMLRFFHQPSIDWIGKWKAFTPISVAAVGLGLVLFVGTASSDPESIFDIEFLGGTSVQIDLKPGKRMADTEVVKAITAPEGDSAVAWLKGAAEAVQKADIRATDQAGIFDIRAEPLGGQQLAAILRHAAEGRIQRDGLIIEGDTIRLVGEGTLLGQSGVEMIRDQAVREALQAAERLRAARVQSVGDPDEEGLPPSYEIATIETNRELVQEAIVHALGPRLEIQQALDFTTTLDEVITREPYYVVETEDQYLSDVIGGDKGFDIRRFRGGVAIEVLLDESEPPISVDEFERRLREVGLQAEFEQFRTVESGIFPLGQAVEAEGAMAYRHFAVLAVDDTLLYEDDPVVWAEQLANTRLAQVEAALGSEKSLSKVVSFAPQIAKQTKNRAIFATVLALAAIVAYLWLRFGTKEFGLAAGVCLVHDVAITLGMLALSQFIYNTIIGKAFLITDFKIDLPMIAALLTVIGYSLNDTIVVFDRIRENRGKAGTLTANLINNSINQTLARTVLTSGTTLLVVLVLYMFGGAGVHGFSFALLIGVGVGTYSSIAVAAPLLYHPAVLRRLVIGIVTLLLIGVVVAEAGNAAQALVFSAIFAAGGLYFLYRDWSRDKVATGRVTPSPA